MVSRRILATEYPLTVLLFPEQVDQAHGVARELVLHERILFRLQVHRDPLTVQRPDLHRSTLQLFHLHENGEWKGSRRLRGDALETVLGTEFTCAPLWR